MWTMDRANILGLKKGISGHNHRGKPQGQIGPEVHDNTSVIARLRPPASTLMKYCHSCTAMFL